MSRKHSYKGYAFDDDSTRTEDGRYRARGILVMVGNSRALSKRFIDLETFAREDDARQRAIAAARAWIDEDEGNRLPASLPCSELECGRGQNP